MSGREANGIRPHAQPTEIDRTRIRQPSRILLLGRYKREDRRIPTSPTLAWARLSPYPGSRWVFCGGCGSHCERQSLQWHDPTKYFSRRKRALDTGGHVSGCGRPFGEERWPRVIVDAITLCRPSRWCRQANERVTPHTCESGTTGWPRGWTRSNPKPCTIASVRSSRSFRLSASCALHTATVVGSLSSSTKHGPSLSGESASCGATFGSS
jgi:hypothetical protein